MYTVTADFIDSIPAGTRVTYGATLQVGATVYTLQMSDGSVAVRDGNIRRTFTGSFTHAEFTSSELYDLISNEGAILRVEVGFDWGGTTEVIPVFTGRVSKAALSMSEPNVTVNAADYGYDLAQQTLIPAVTQAASVTRRNAIKALVQAGFPGVVITDTATDTGTLGSEQTWSGSRWDAIQQLASDGRMDCFFGPDGKFIIRDLPQIGAPVYLMRTADGGTITSYKRERPLDRLFNAVVVKPKTTDGSQTWEQVYVEITDTASPRHKSKIGVRSVTVDNVTGSATDALAVANAKLEQVQGRTETIALEAIANPALELGDTVQIVSQPWLDSPATAVTHMVDGYTFKINDWSMTVATRNMGEN